MFALNLYNWNSLKPELIRNPLLFIIFLQEMFKATEEEEELNLESKLKELSLEKN